MREYLDQTYEGFIVFAAFCAVFFPLFLPSSNLLEIHSNLSVVFGIAAVCIAVKLYLVQVDISLSRTYQRAFFYYHRIVAGVGLGLTLGTIVVLGKWYEEPDLGKWEPLFTATGLSSAGVVWCERWAAEQTKANETEGS